MDFVSFIVWFIAAAIVLLIVDRLNLGIKVGGFVNAGVAAIVIAIVAVLMEWLFGTVLGIQVAGGLLGSLAAAAVVLNFAGRIMPGMTVSGCGGAVIGAIAIAVVGGVLNWVVSLF